MYIDAIIIVALIIIAFGWFRRFSKAVYALAIIDMFLRLIDFVANNLGLKDFKIFVNNTFPNSIPDLIDNYASGVLYDVLLWSYVVLMICFLAYTFRIFVRKK